MLNGFFLYKLVLNVLLFFFAGAKEVHEVQYKSGVYKRTKIAEVTFIRMPFRVVQRNKQHRWEELLSGRFLPGSKVKIAFNGIENSTTRILYSIPFI